LSIDSLADKTLAEIGFDYVSRSSVNVFKHLDDDFENLLSFKSSLEDYFLSVKELQIYFVSDNVLSDKNSISVRLHWFKSEINNAGSFKKTKGASQFVFKIRPDGPKLLYIRGDNPFF